MQAASHPDEWVTHGGTYAEQRFSQLDKLNETNVSQLGLAWYSDIDTERGQESTPVVVDGVMYVTTAWSMVKAYDIKTGAELWAYDPQINRAKGADACCDVVNRGVAAWNGKIYLGALDGRLIALDGKTGKPVWETQTTDTNLPYTINWPVPDAISSASTALAATGSARAPVPMGRSSDSATRARTPGPLSTRARPSAKRVASATNVAAFPVCRRRNTRRPISRLASLGGRAAANS